MIRRRRPEARTGARTDDAGFTLTETLVTLGVMSAVMVIFSGSIIQMYRTSAKTESISVIQSQLQTAFQRFDRQLRYASWISPPGQVGTAWYVEWAGYDGARCYQLRLETAPADRPADESAGRGVLQMLDWPRESPPAPGTPGQTIAANLATPDSTGPFVREIPRVTTDTSTTFSPDFQRLQVRITGTQGDSVAQVDSTFTALNTSRDTPETNDCGKGRPT
jgi:prepilin-type N-terminal cleavage/methylation domain-containing protein